ncbi:glycosyltransferase family 39 protein [candidate division KSB1 bacterium]|nr:glycosyltransferase family 39 protein [candidate division KSB1 bacterium]
MKIYIFFPRAFQFFKNHIMVVFFVFALFLRLYRIDQQCLWSDECASLGGARLASTISVLSHSSRFHPPLYYLLLHFWSDLGLNEFTLRFPSAVFCAFLIPVLFMLGRELADTKVGLVAAFLGIFNPFLVWYAQEVRMYALLLLLSGLNILFFLYILNKKKRIYWLVFITTLFLGMLTHLSAVFLVIFQMIFLIVSRNKYRHLFSRLIWIYSAAFLLVLMIMPHFMYTIVNERAYGLFQGQVVWGRLFALPYSFFAFSAGFSVGPSLQSLHDVNAYLLLRQYWGIVLPFFTCYLFVFLLGMKNLIKHKEKFLFLILLLLIPLLIVYLLANFSLIHTYNVRYACIALLAYILMLSYGVTALGKIRFFVMIGLLTLLNIVSLSNYYHNPSYFKPDIRSVADYIEISEQPGDVILSDEPGLFKMYFHGRSHVDLLWIDPSKIEGMEKFHYIQSRMQGKKRLWLIPNRLWAFDPQGEIMNYFNKLDKIEEKQFVGIRTFLFKLNAE